MCISGPMCQSLFIVSWTRLSCFCANKVNVSSPLQIVSRGLSVLCCHVFFEMSAGIVCVLTVLFPSLSQGGDEDEEVNGENSAADGAAGGDEEAGVGADDDDEGPQVCTEKL